MSSLLRHIFLSPLLHFLVANNNNTPNNNNTATAQNIKSEQDIKNSTITNEETTIATTTNYEEKGNNPIQTISEKACSWPSLPTISNNNITSTHISYYDIVHHKAVDFVRSLQTTSTTMSHRELENTSNQITFLLKGPRIPRITMYDYIIRIIKYINRYYDDNSNSLSIGCIGFIHLLGGFVLLERLTLHTDTILNEWTVHRALITSVLIAHKILEDDRASNQFFARVGGITLQEMNTLEIVVCETLDFDLHVGNRLWEIANIIIL
jgi:hypothetical protein